MFATKEIEKEYMHNYYIKHIDKIKASSSEYRENHKDKYSEYNKEYRKNNFSKIKIAKDRWYQNNKDLVRGNAKIWQLNNPETDALCKRLNSAKRRKYVRNYDKITVKQVNQLKEIQENKCFYCDAELEKFHIDHIIPVAKGGEHKMYNLVLACQHCNCTKHTKDPEEFVDYILKKVS